ncbi:protein MFI [Aplysia californica]|uniref:Protein MFI n=1 Tax=Aplysia californica TaxID=6500 RepID=A0ABM0JRR3_APLCA|nr:protein MFI [Aplysia californica]
MDNDNPIAKLQMEQLYNQYVQEQMDLNIPSTDIASFGYFCSHLAPTWRPGQYKRRQQPENVPEGHGPSVSLPQLRDQDGGESPANRELSMASESSFLQSSRIKSEADAAVIIQRVWRRHIDMQVYKYYRDLINFKTRGNPGVMLRCINPNEAKLLDAAAGINIRFRLAGARFPPNIYYKIFTNRPVQDMCANSPKDYTKSESKRLTVKDTHSNVRVKDVPNDDQDGWYKRVENNGWRLVSDRLIHHIMNDPITWETSNKEYKFDHNRYQRRQDVERRKKQKKIEWMQKMYKEGMLRAKADDRETIQLIEGAAAGMVATVEAAGPEALEDWEVDELLDWTTSLNFEEYRNTWSDLATSATSQKFVEDKLRLTTNFSDPYEMSLSTGPSRYTSGRQSHMTPVTINSADSGKAALKA